MCDPPSWQSDAVSTRGVARGTHVLCRIANWVVGIGAPHPNLGRSPQPGSVASTWVGRLNLGRSPQPGSVASTWVGRLNLGRSPRPTRPLSTWKIRKISIVPRAHARHHSPMEVKMTASGRRESEAIRAHVAQTSPALQAFFQAELARAKEVLAGGAAPPSVLGVNAAARVAHHLEQLAVANAPACAPGCSWCCRGRAVEVLAPEAVAIAAFLAGTRSADDLAGLQAQIARASHGTRALDEAQRWREQTPCFFLNAGTAECSIYPVRPLVCRLHNSVDRDQCRRASEDATQNTPVPRHAAFEILYGLAQSAIIVACLEAGLDARSLELTTAVDVALREPEASARWACGERLFEPAATRSEPARASPTAPRAIQPGLVPSERLVANTSSVARNARKRERRARRDGK
ncbi:YkgJ family cysteine cluster protein [Sorangium sp. So ce385]|uniref:YkgJ family cysteine cluster protein n=1 Tax=Sorangium sp. So ce385 TaxID=3133308 RepID=UPI003F5AEB42